MNTFEIAGNINGSTCRNGGIRMKKKYAFGFMSVILSAGFLFGCDGVDEDEPDPSEEPTEQQEDNSQ